MPGRNWLAVISFLFTGASAYAGGGDCVFPPTQTCGGVAESVCCDTANSARGHVFGIAGVDISGWTEASFTAGTAGGSHLPMGFNFRSNDFLLQQNWLRLQRRVDEDSSRPSFGLHSDWILPGSDYRFTRARGLFDSQSGRVGIDPVQFYVEGFFPDAAEGLNVKFGRFFAPFGVESIAGPDNTLVSHSYSFIYNPFTQTGVLGTMTLNENWSVRGGVVLGNDVFIDSVNNATFVAGFHWQDDCETTTIDFFAISGRGRFDQPEQFNNPRVFDLVITRQLSDSVSITLEGLGGYEKDFPGVGTAVWYSGVGYVTYEICEDVSMAARIELFNDEHGNRTGSRGLYTAVTGGLAWNLTQHLLFRPELRFDHNSETRPFNGDESLYTATGDLILFW